MRFAASRSRLKLIGRLRNGFGTIWGYELVHMYVCVWSIASIRRFSFWFQFEGLPPRRLELCRSLDLDGA